MNQQGTHDAMKAERISLTAYLRELPEAAWEKPSLCPGWSVRDVVAHLIGNVADVNTLNLDGATKPFEQENTFASPRIAVIDNNIYSHYAILARLYDWAARGPQSLQVLIPQDLTPGTIKLEAAGTQQVDGTSLELLRATTESLEVDLYLDSSHRLMRLTVPDSKVVVLRE